MLRQNLFLLSTVPPSIPDADIELNPKVFDNGTTTFLCPAEGVPTPNILWLKSGVLVDPNASSRFTVSGGGRKLVISPTKVEDTGEYVCVASNEAGESELNFKLDVWGMFLSSSFPPEISLISTLLSFL